MARPLHQASERHWFNIPNVITSIRLHWIIWGFWMSRPFHLAVFHWGRCLRRCPSWRTISSSLQKKTQCENWNRNNLNKLGFLVRNAQVAASLLKACCLAIIKPISGCVHIACSGLMITSLLQVVNRLDVSWLSRLFIHKLDPSCCSKSDFHRHDEVNLIESRDLQQAGKIHNLQHVCRVSCCVLVAPSHSYIQPF